MNSTKTNTVDVDNDLKFTPLSLKEPFKSKDSSWVPFINIDVATEHMTNNFFIGLPNLQTNQGLIPLPDINTTPILPYPSLNPSQKDSDSKVVDDTMNSNNNQNTPSDDTNFTKKQQNIIDQNNLYPSEISEDELYSYNEDSDSSSYNKNNKNRLTHLEILRDFDLSIDEDFIKDTRGSSTTSVDKVFNSIEKNNAGILATLKTYKIPYPIASLIIKKIIKVTLNFNKEE